MAGGHQVVCVPRGYTFDLASIPRWLWWLVAPFELSLAAPLVHDWLYEFTGCVNPVWMEDEQEWYVPKMITRAQADLVFDELMERSHVKNWRRRGAYQAVKLFSGRIWRRRVKTSIFDRLARVKDIVPHL